LVKIGDFNKLEVKRSTDFGYFLDGKTKNSKDDILLHKRLIGKNEVNVGDTVDAFIYIDSEGRKAATLIPPKAKVNVNPIFIDVITANTDPPTDKIPLMPHMRGIDSSLP